MIPRVCTHINIESFQLEELNDIEYDQEAFFIQLLFHCQLPVMYAAQANILNATKVDEIGKQTDARIAADNDGPLAYGYIDERDILWSKVVWEFVDLNQKINLPYYFPIDTSNIPSDRRSLFDSLLKGIR